MGAWDGRSHLAVAVCLHPHAEGQTKAQPVTIQDTDRVTDPAR